MLPGLRATRSPRELSRATFGSLLLSRKDGKDEGSGIAGHHGVGGAARGGIGLATGGYPAEAIYGQRVVGNRETTRTCPRADPAVANRRSHPCRVHIGGIPNSGPMMGRLF